MAPTVDIGSASPNQVYSGIVNPTYQSISDQWGVIQFIPTPGIAHYDPGYVQGMSAGSIQILGSSLVLNGNFVGQAVNGVYQRSGPVVASGGTFSIGLIPASNSGIDDYRAPAVELVNQVPDIVVDPGANLPPDLPVQLSTALFSSGGFSHLDIASNDRISIASGVTMNLPPGGSINFVAPQIYIGSSISAPGGSIELTSSLSATNQSVTPSSGISVGSGVTLDVNGMWVNDTLTPLNQTPSGLALINAGSIALEQQIIGGTLQLGDNVQLLANGGAQLPRGASLIGGTGGSIALVGQPGGSVQVGNNDQVSGLGVQGAMGGAFTLEAPRILISSGDSTWLRAQTVDSDPNSSAYLILDSSLFSDFGFASFSITADGPSQAAAGASQDILTVAPGTSIDLRTRTLLLNSNAYIQASGTPLTSFSSAGLLPTYQRSGAALLLQALPGNISSSQIGNLTVGAGTTIVADPGASITLASIGNLTFDGAIQSPAGAVELEILTPSASIGPGVCTHAPTGIRFLRPNRCLRHHYLPAEQHRHFERSGARGRKHHVKCGPRLRDHRCRFVDRFLRNAGAH